MFSNPAAAARDLLLRQQKVVNTWYRFEEPHNLLKNLGLVRLAGFEPATSCSGGY